MDTKNGAGQDVPSIDWLACPFCGSEEVWVQEDADDWGRRNPRYYYYGDCPDCKAQGPRANTEDEAKTLWNNRRLTS